MECQVILTASIEKEFESASLGDKRLMKRLVTVAKELSKQPDASFPQVFNHSGLAGAYRLLNNEKATPSAILAPHVAQTVERAAAHEEVIVAHDTTEFNFGTNPRKGLGNVGRGKSHGFKSHVSLVIVPGETREPLGVIAVQTVNRKKKKKKRKTKNRKKTNKTRRTKRGHKELQRAKDNEGRRWLEGIEETRQRLGDKTSAIHVMDREGDCYALLAALCENNDRFVIRTAYDRQTYDSPTAARGTGKKLRMVLEQAPVLGSREIFVSCRDASPLPSYRKNFPPRNSRKATVSVAATRVIIKRPASSSECPAKTLTLNIVRVFEKNPTDGQPPVEWLLWTTEPIETDEQLWKVVDIYCSRWVIEEFFKAIKTGCSFEKRQFESADALFRALAIFMPIAWRLLLLRTLCRHDEETPAEKALNPVQLLNLREAMRELKVELPEQPTVRDAMLGIAKLGGHRKQNGEPGWFILARGFERLILMEQGFRLGMKAATRRTPRRHRIERTEYRLRDV